MKFIKPILWMSLLLVVSGAFIASTWPFVGPQVIEYCNRIPFDSVAWKDLDQVYSENPVRLRMVDDLLKRFPLVGMKREEIDDLLGPKTETPYFGAYDYVYWLGMERSFISIDSEWLVIKLRENKVVEAGIARD